MPKGRENKTVVSAGSFYRGMMPDIIGAKDSMVFIEDGWIDRAGEIRKRGGKGEMFSTDKNTVIETSTVFSSFAIEDPSVAMFITGDGQYWHKVGSGFPSPSQTITATDPKEVSDCTTFGPNVISVGPNGNRVWENSTNAVRDIVDPTWDPTAISAVACTTHNSRVFVGNVPEGPYGGSRIRWSGTPDDAPGEAYDIWKEPAYSDVFPGIGGNISALESFLGQLVIFKTNAVFVLRGDTSTNAFDLGARTDFLVATSGAAGPRHVSTYNNGIVWANTDGIWQYNGRQVTNLTDGRAKSYWRSFSSGLAYNTFHVCGVGDRIIVINDLDDKAFIYDSEKDLFYAESVSNPGPVESINDSEPGATFVEGTGMAFVNWADDFNSALENDFGSTEYPRLNLITQPLSPTYPFYTDRPNKLLVSGYITDDTTDPSLEASILHGRNELDTSGDAEQILEYGFRARGYDNTERIPIPGVPDRPANRFRLRQTDSAQDIRIYGIGAEYLGDFTTDSSDEAGASGYGS